MKPSGPGSSGLWRTGPPEVAAAGAAAVHSVWRPGENGACRRGRNAGVSSTETSRRECGSWLAPHRGLRYTEQTSSPARRPIAGAMPGRCGFCLAAKRTGPLCLGLKSPTTHAKSDRVSVETRHSGWGSPYPDASRALADDWCLNSDLSAETTSAADLVLLGFGRNQHGSSSESVADEAEPVGRGLTLVQDSRRRGSPSPVGRISEAPGDRQSAHHLQPKLGLVVFGELELKLTSCV
jgi:hypothetical protein